MQSVAIHPHARNPWTHWLREEWAPVVFVVALITVLHHGPLATASRISLLLLSMAQVVVGGQRDEPEPKIWLLGIDGADFERRHFERRPLDRCVLADDLAVILKERPKVLVIDLDLSPAPPKPNQSDDSTRCQKRIDDVLDTPMTNTDIVLMRPFDVYTPELRDSKSAWLREREHVYVANRDIHLGVTIRAAIEFECDPEGLAEMAAWRKRDGQRPCEAMHSGQPFPLNYAAFESSVRQQSTSNLGGEVKSLADTTVFFGSRFGRADSVATPLGSSHGIVVQTARFATLQKYEEMRTKSPIRYALLMHRGIVNLVLDLAMALLFSWFVSQFMHRYVAVAQETSPASASRLSLMLLQFALGYLALITLVALAALSLVVFLGLITEPLLIALGLAFDGLVVAAWSHIGKPASASGDGLPWWPKRFAEIFRVSRGAAVVELARWGVFWGVVLWAALSILH